MFVDSISLFASLDRSLPQDSDTLRFVQQCLGGMGLKPDSISARGQWIQIWWVFYVFISLMDPAWVSWILRILRTSDVDSGSTWLCDTHTYWYWSYIVLISPPSRQWLTLVLGGIAILCHTEMLAVKQLTWPGHYMVKWRSHKDFIMLWNTWPMHAYCIILVLYM